jgi:hypothetical protein
MTDPARPAPDPVAQAAAYQQSLLAALGDDDPAEAQAETPANIRAMLADAGSELRTRPAPREWSALLCLAHLVDAEVVMTGRYRWTLAHDRPELIGYDHDLWPTTSTVTTTIRSSCWACSSRFAPRTSRSGVIRVHRTGPVSRFTGSAVLRATT